MRRHTEFKAKLKAFNYAHAVGPWGLRQILETDRKYISLEFLSPRCPHFFQSGR